MEEKEKKKYEISFWLKEENAASVAAVLEKNGGEISLKEEVKKKQLGYPIKKERYAFWGTMTFLSFPEAVQKIREALRLDNSVLRHVIRVADKRESAGVERKAGDNEMRGLQSFQNRQGYGGSFKKTEGDVLTNEVLEKKIEEILN